MVHVDVCVLFSCSCATKSDARSETAEVQPSRLIAYGPVPHDTCGTVTSYSPVDLYLVLDVYGTWIYTKRKMASFEIEMGIYIPELWHICITPTHTHNESSELRYTY